MKKVLLSSVALSLFSLSILLVQMSCGEQVIAQNNSNYILPTATTTTLGGVIPDGTTINVDTNGKISVLNSGQGHSTINKILIYEGQTFATIDYNGSNKKIIPIPSDLHLRSSPPTAMLSPDGNTLFFEVYDGTYYLYSIKTDGTDLKKIASSDDEPIGFLGAY